MTRNDLRNVAIIAHVDHGKTTLLDGMLKQTGSLESHKAMGERIMDSSDQERERGITILAKNTAISYRDTLINIVDTPGHADLGGEVERILDMVDGALLLVDAFEGPMPQTRFVLSRALAMNLHLIVLINKIDRPGARPQEALNGVYDLFIDLGASEEQVDFPVLYTSAKLGYAVSNPEEPPQNLTPLLDCIVDEVPPPEGDADGPFQFLVSSVGYDPYLGRLLVGRIHRGRLALGQTVVHLPAEGEPQKGRIASLFGFKGLQRVKQEQALAGDIVAISGISDATVGETLSDPEFLESLPGISVTQPTISMTFRVNDSPLAGKEGRYVTSRKIRDRLFRETLSDVALKVEDTDSPDEFRVSGRGLLHLGILIETLRREDYEFAVSRPEVIFRETENGREEPIEELILDLPEESMGAAMESLGGRKGELLAMEPQSGGRQRLRFAIPTRTLIGFRSEYLTMTRGEGIMTHAFKGFQPYRGARRMRNRGAIIAMNKGETSAYALWQLEDRGSFIVPPGIQVYEGMVVGLCNKDRDLVVNTSRKKQLTNIRASGHDDAIRLTPHLNLSLEAALELIEADELVEVTPKSIRVRKKILNQTQRESWEKRHKAEMAGS